MATNPSPTQTVKPWDDATWLQMNTMLTVTIPQQEDLLDRSAKAGLDVTAAKQALADSKAKLSGLISQFKDLYK